MKFFVLLVTFIGLAAAQRFNDPRCPSGPSDMRPDRFGHPWDCNTFFRCHNGQAIELHCPSGMHWSSHALTCDLPNRAQCQQTIMPPRPQPIAPAPPSSGLPTFMQCPAFDIPGEFVYFPHPNECQHFYQCSAGRAVMLSCPSGHMWNIERTFCDREQNVNCRLPRRL